MLSPEFSRFPRYLLLAVGALAGCSEAPESSSDPPTDQLAATEAPTFVGSDACAACHQTQFAAWQDSHHDLAMQPATTTTVLGDFDDSSFSYDGGNQPVLPFRGRILGTNR